MSDDTTNPYQPPQSIDRNFGVPDSTFVMSGCLNVADAIAAHRLANGYSRWLPAYILFVFVFCGVLIAVGVSSRRFATEASNVILLTAGVIVPSLILLPVAVGRLRLWRLAQRKSGMFAATDSRISQSGITVFSIRNQDKVELSWEHFSHYVANDRVALLFYVAVDQHAILARSKLDPTEHWDSLVALLHDRLPAVSNSTQSAQVDDSR